MVGYYACGAFIFIGHRKKGLCADFLVHAAGPENLMIFFFFGLRLKILEGYILLNLLMEVFYTCPDVRYWSEVLCCTNLMHMSDLEVKVTDLEKNMVKFLV